MVGSFLVFVAIDIGCFLLLALLFSAVSGKNDMNFGSIIHVLSDSCEIECLPESMIIIERVKNNEHKNTYLRES